MLIAREKLELCCKDAFKTLDNRAGIGIFIPEKQVDVSLRTSSHSCISSTELAIEDCLWLWTLCEGLLSGEDFNVVIFSDSLSKNRHYKGADWPMDSSVYQGCQKVCGLQHHPTVANQMGWRPRSLHYKTVEKLVSTKSKFQCVSWKKEALIFRLRLGKCALNRCLFLMKRHRNGKCEVCTQEDETVRHFIMECPAQSVLREKISLKTNLIEMSPMLSNPASVDLIWRWICEKRTLLIISICIILIIFLSWLLNLLTICYFVIANNN